MDDPEAAREWRRRNVAINPRFQAGAAEAPAPRADVPAEATAAQAIDYREERARRERAEADLAELKLAELRGDLLRREEMERLVGSLASHLRESVLQIKGRLAPLLAAETDVMKVSSMLDTELRAALEKAVR
jgi:phage terminase Nu1 subunit (DNA packaging protein)